MSHLPLVSVICTCYNHENYVFDALNSVINQKYKNLELVIIDNGSRDSSVEVIKNWLWLHDYFQPLKTYFYIDPQNYCKVFNTALEGCNGKYIIDLAADDRLLENHVATAVKVMEKSKAGVYFSNARLTYPNGRYSTFYLLGTDGKLLHPVSDGDIYLVMVERYSVCSVTMVFRTLALQMEGGYDETLSYEDFDIMVRMGRKYAFVFDENIGVEKRILKNSFSANQYKIKSSTMLPSTYKVLRKIQQMNKTEEENRALACRVMHELKHALASSNFDVAGDLLELAKELNVKDVRFWVYQIWYKLRFDISFFYRLYARI